MKSLYTILLVIGTLLSITDQAQASPEELRDALLNGDYRYAHQIISSDENIDPNLEMYSAERYKGVTICYYLAQKANWRLLESFIGKYPEADVNVFGHRNELKGQTVLLLAAQGGAFRVVELILKNCANVDINACEKGRQHNVLSYIFGKPPISTERWSLIELALEKYPEADVNALLLDDTNSGKTLFWTMASHGKWNLVSLVVEKNPNVDINAKNKAQGSKYHDENVISLAASNKQWATVDLILMKFPNLDLAASGFSNRLLDKIVADNQFELFYKHMTLFQGATISFACVTNQTDERFITTLLLLSTRQNVAKTFKQTLPAALLPCTVHNSYVHNSVYIQKMVKSIESARLRLHRSFSSAALILFGGDAIDESESVAHLPFEMREYICIKLIRTENPDLLTFSDHFLLEILNDYLACEHSQYFDKAVDIIAFGVTSERLPIEQRAHSDLMCPCTKTAVCNTQKVIQEELHRAFKQGNAYGKLNYAKRQALIEAIARSPGMLSETSIREAIISVFSD